MISWLKDNGGWIVPLIGPSISVVAFIVALYSLRLSRRSAVTSQMVAYIDRYSTTGDYIIKKYSSKIGMIENPYSSYVYFKMIPHDRAKVQIVLGLLSGLIEQLDSNGEHDRGRQWRKFLSGIPGPFLDTKGADPTVYAATTSLKLTLRQIRRNLLAKSTESP